MATRQRERIAKRLETADTRPYATAKYIRMGASKAKRLLDIIRGVGYAQAVAILENSDSSSAADIKKVLISAGANAENNKGLNKDDLIVAECFANQGPTLKRGIFRGKGGQDRILKRTCHITIILDVAKK